LGIATLQDGGAGAAAFRQGSESGTVILTTINVADLFEPAKYFR
jgi:hypothetical protein